MTFYTKLKHIKGRTLTPELFLATIAFAPSVLSCFSHLDCISRPMLGISVRLPPMLLPSFSMYSYLVHLSNPVWYGIDSQKSFALLCNCVSSSPIPGFFYSSPHCSFTFCVVSGFTGRWFPSPRSTKLLTLKADTLFPSWHGWHYSDTCKVPTVWNFFLPPWL